MLVFLAASGLIRVLQATIKLFEQVAPETEHEDLDRKVADLMTSCFERIAAGEDEDVVQAEMQQLLKELDGRLQQQNAG